MVGSTRNSFKIALAIPIIALIICIASAYFFEAMIPIVESNILFPLCACSEAVVAGALYWRYPEELGQTLFKQDHEYYDMIGYSKVAGKMLLLMGAVFIPLFIYHYYYGDLISIIIILALLVAYVVLFVALFGPSRYLLDPDNKPPKRPRPTLGSITKV